MTSLAIFYPIIIICVLVTAVFAYDRGFEDALELIEERGLAHWRALSEAQEDFYNKEDNS